jgi:hypothetical protein
MNLDDIYVREVNALVDQGAPPVKITRPASPADILPRLGFEECGDCGGTGEKKVHCLFGLGGPADDHDDEGCPDPAECEWVDDHPCFSCRRGWQPGDEMVEVLRASILSDGGYISERQARAAALARLVQLLEGN